MTNLMHMVVVGGGAAGALMALLFLRAAPQGRVTVLDRRGAFGRGVAYGPAEDCHRINVPAFKMGGLALEDESGFERWLAANGRAATSFDASLVPRRWFGDYLADELGRARSTGRLSLVQAEVNHLARQADGRWLCAGQGLSLAADRLVLCPGNPPPSRPLGGDAGPRYVADVWGAPDALAGIDPSHEVLVLGSGSTALDAVLTLLGRGQRGRMTLVSRHGLIPQVDVPSGSYPDFFSPGGPVQGVRGVTRRLRDEVRRAAAAGLPWQWVVDAFRVHLGAVWQRLDEADRRRFLRHVRAIWMIHRHRLAPDIAAQLAAARADGRLLILAGELRRTRVAAAAPGCELEYRPRGEAATRWLRGDWMLNCIGPSEDLSRLDEPLWRDLFARGVVRPGPLGLGLDVDAQLRVVAADGRPHPDLFTIGLPTRGRFWEVTAVLHIRQQAQALAARLAGAPAAAAIPDPSPPPPHPQEHDHVR